MGSTQVGINFAQSSHTVPSHPREEIASWQSHRQREACSEVVAPLFALIEVQSKAVGSERIMIFVENRVKSVLVTVDLTRVRSL